MKWMFYLYKMYFFILIYKMEIFLCKLIMFGFIYFESKCIFVNFGCKFVDNVFV